MRSGKQQYFCPIVAKRTTIAAAAIHNYLSHFAHCGARCKELVFIDEYNRPWISLAAADLKDEFSYLTAAKIKKSLQLLELNNLLQTARWGNMVGYHIKGAE